MNKQSKQKDPTMKNFDESNTIQDMLLEASGVVNRWQVMDNAVVK